MVLRRIIYENEVGLGFFYGKANNPQTIKSDLIYECDWGTTLVWLWISTFNSYNLVGPKLPTEVTLKQLL